jgi:hypothetical protein
LRELPDLTPSRKQPCVSGHPTHNPGIFILHFSLQDAPTPWALLSTREWHPDGPRLLQVTIGDIAEAEGGKNLLLAERVERRASHRLDDFSQQDEPSIAVSHHRPRTGDDGFSMHLGIDGTAPVKRR